jgi:small subunit ribosomal protein S13
MFITFLRKASLILLMSNREFKEIVRIAGVDCDGKRKVLDGLSLVKGLGWATARAICITLNIPMDTRLGYLSEEEVARIEAALNNLGSMSIPAWMLNRRRDPVTGENKHLLTSDLELTQKMDIERMMRIKSWKGVRHSLGLKVRGQRTRTTGRTGGPVGFSKAALKQAESEKK